MFSPPTFIQVYRIERMGSWLPEMKWSPEIMTAIQAIPMDAQPIVPADFLGIRAPNMASMNAPAKGVSMAIHRL